ncbi:family 78 glycoside hydrolase catalytic domain [Microbacterium sp. C5A9]|uniref:alpha-L-rhamnosidase n=1 Tax=Microbacterium sp. C5A9 TaxID=2736663 RepID=UPI001F5250BD|nr:alpha-L-rhamnosidase [Microbacterium sp. C5A9]MCI1020025.1 family 78 glycoside hydrolase catalytic domain [Microbacterium sp. C5A9]
MITSVPAPQRPTLEHHADGRLGIVHRAPRISWTLSDAPRGYAQRAYRLELTRSVPGGETTTSVFERTESAQILVPWPDSPLSSRERVAVRVAVSDGTEWSPWSEAGWVEAGLFDAADWQAEFIGGSWPETSAPEERRPSRVRTDLHLEGGVAWARLRLTAHGLAEAEINGVRVGDEELTPGWTSYRHRLPVATFDVTDMLVPGDNAIGVWLSDGWWRGHLGFEGGRWDVYGDDLSAFVQLEVLFDDGTFHIHGSDATWQAGFGPVLSSGLYAGESVDLTRHDPSWSTPGWTDEDWTPVSVSSADTSVLVGAEAPPVRCTAELPPVRTEIREEGRVLLDFGQNHSGRLRLRLPASRGTEIVIRHAEVLQDGDIYTRTLRHARAEDRVVLSDTSMEWEPRGTIHGFRYVEISGWPGEIADGDVVSRVLHTDMERTGWFRSSHAAVNRLHENAVWSLRSNFVSIPTDCPQRDERLGWTGDLQVFAPTAAFLYDVTGMLGSWLQDLADEQDDLGTVPLWVPFVALEPWSSFPASPMAVWSDVAVLAPDTLHERTGDTAVLRRQWRSGLAWIAESLAGAGDSLIVDGGFQLGDWLDPSAPPESPMQAVTPSSLVASAYLVHSLRRLTAIGRVLGEEREVDRLDDLAVRAAAAFRARFLDADGSPVVVTQTALALITVFDLWPDDAAAKAGTRRLAELVQENDGRVATGFAGTNVISDALSLGGHDAAAYRLLEADENPSWLYTVAMGATTIWERWDSMLPDGTVNPGDMTSFNHYALGAVADWMHRRVAGLAPGEPGYRRIRFAPRPGGSFTSAGATHRTPYGEASIDWVRRDGELDLTIRVPVGAVGDLELPGGETRILGHGLHALSVPAPLSGD